MSTLVATLLTFCPPGPELELNVIFSSCRGGEGALLWTQVITENCLKLSWDLLTTPHNKLIIDLFVLPSNFTVILLSSLYLCLQ